jgi:anti-anti-sigma factor
MPTAVELKNIHDTPTIELRGSLGDGDIDEFVEKMDSLVQTNHGRIIVDISGVSFIGSFGLGKLVSYNARLKKANRELVLLNTNPDPEAFVASLLKLTNLNKVLKIVADPAQL